MEADNDETEARREARRMADMAKLQFAAAREMATRNKVEKLLHVKSYLRAVR